jgi:hypothetical protein
MYNFLHTHTHTHTNKDTIYCGLHSPRSLQLYHTHRIRFGGILSNKKEKTKQIGTTAATIYFIKKRRI